MHITFQSQHYQTSIIISNTVKHKYMLETFRNYQPVTPMSVTSPIRSLGTITRFPQVPRPIFWHGALSPHLGTARPTFNPFVWFGFAWFWESPIQKLYQHQSFRVCLKVGMTWENWKFSLCFPLSFSYHWLRRRFLTSLVGSAGSSRVSAAWQEAKPWFCGYFL